MNIYIKVANDYCDRFGIPGEMGGNLIGPGHPGFGPYVNDPFGNPNGGIGGPRLPRY